MGTRKNESDVSAANDRASTAEPLEYLLPPLDAVRSALPGMSVRELEQFKDACSEAAWHAEQMFDLAHAESTMRSCQCRKFGADFQHFPGCGAAPMAQPQNPLEPLAGVEQRGAARDTDSTRETTLPSKTDTIHCRYCGAHQGIGAHFDDCSRLQAQAAEHASPSGRT